ncbi:MAG: type 4a pilus biogenesis protein PilO [Sedimentisphaerales bacterium]|nr:type 4a pilus biogenesis protein PilO [Sedimentisphaerales bacterium]
MLICKNPKIFDVDLYAVAALLLFAGLGWLFLFKPMGQKMGRAQQDQQRILQENDSIHAQVNQLEVVIQDQRSLAQQARQNAGLLNCSTDIPEVIRSLGSLADHCGLRLDEITPSPTTGDERFYKTPIALQLYGSFPCLYDLLEKIPVKLPFVRIGSLALDRGQSEQGCCVINLSLDAFAAR